MTTTRRAVPASRQAAGARVRAAKSHHQRILHPLFRIPIGQSLLLDAFATLSLNLPLRSRERAIEFPAPR